MLNDIVLCSLSIILLGTYWEPALSINALEFRQVLLGARAPVVPTTCTGNTAQVICKQCTQLVFCTPNGSAKPTEQEITKCTAPQTCSTGVCSNNPNDKCVPYSGVKYSYTVPGMYPDADCKKYFVVVKGPTGTPIQYSQTCEPDGEVDYGFSMKTLTCSNKLIENKCPKDTLPSCSEPGLNPYDKNKEYYYMCIKSDGGYYPYFQYCAHGKHYTAGQGCVDPAAAAKDPANGSPTVQ